MIQFDALDFSECRFEEVISFFWRSVYANSNNKWLLHSDFLVCNTTVRKVYDYPGHWSPYQSCTFSAPSQLIGEHFGETQL